MRRVTPPQMPWRVAAVLALAGLGVGAVFGFVRGLSYLPTLPVAVVEGALLFGVPAALVGLVAAWVHSLREARRPRRRGLPRRHEHRAGPFGSGGAAR